MNRTWFHGVDHLLLWLMCAVVLCTLNLAFYEMGSSDQGYFSEDAAIPKRSEEAQGNDSKRIFIVFVEGLKTGHLIRHIHKSRVLTRVVIHEGAWGEMSWEPPPPGFVGFEPFFTGNPEGHGPSILAVADRVTFIGRPDLARGLKLPSKFTKLLVPSDELIKQMKVEEKSLDEIVIHYTIGLSASKELWDLSLKREVVILHLTAVGHANRNEGHNSLRGTMALYEVFDQLDLLFNSMRRDYPYLGVSYFVTSVGMQVPIIAWGEGIDKAKFPSNRNYQNPGFTVPTVPRKLDVLSMAPLLACLLDTPPPPNSIGELPEDYMGLEKRGIAICQLEVAMGVKNLYLHQAQQVLTGGWVKLAAFDERDASPEELENLSNRLQTTMEARDYAEVGTVTKMLINQCLGSIHYYRNFRFLILSNIVLFMLIGCMLCCLTLLFPAIDESANLEENREWLRIPSLKPIPTLDAIFFITFSILLIIVGVDNFPARYHLYVTATVVPWWLAVRNARNWLQLTQGGRNQRGPVTQKMIDFIYFVIILLTGSTTANKIPIMGIYLVSMVFVCLTALISTSDSKVTLWMFTTMPMVASLSYNYDKDVIYQVNILASLVWIVVSWSVALYSSWRITDYPIIISNTVVALIIMLGKESMVYHLAWLVLGSIPFIGSTNLMTRFSQIFMSSGIPYLLLTTSGETVNLIVFVVHTLTWMVAESYDDLNDLVIQTIPAGRRSSARRLSPMDMRMNYFYNLYAMLAGALVYPDKYNDECTLFSPIQDILGRLMSCEFKLAIPVLCLTVIHVHMIKRNGGQRYYSLLLSFFYFAYIIFFSFLDVYKSSWDEDMESSHELNLVHGPLNVWSAVLACSWIADFLMCPPVFSRKSAPAELPLQSS
uniref:GPI ethanolamine phosphate transferase 1 n=1 Tax=Lygus hesperus TaxID=30085 RepID=A0A0A9YGI6_LYGHE